MSDIANIIFQRERLDKELRMALATMERSDKIEQIRKEQIANQSRCPHNSSEFNWAIVDDTCPYCGFHFSK